MANYGLGVVAHVDRQGQIKYLSEAAKPDIVMVDDGSLGATINHLAVVTALYQTASRSGLSWVVVLEDDAKVCEGFHQQLSSVLDEAPTPIVSLYNGTGYPGHYQGSFAALAGSYDVHFILHKAMRHAVGYALHLECFERGVIDHLTKKSRERCAPDDALGDWCRGQNLQVAYANPSLVDHEDGPTVIRQRFSLTGPVTSPRRRSRKAHWFGGRAKWHKENVFNLDKA